MPFGPTVWSPERDAEVRRRYPKESGEALAASLGISTSALWQRVNRLGIAKHPRWTAADDERLLLLWGETSLEGVAAAMGRTVRAAYWRAKLMGLPLGCPQGHEYLSAAAARTGYATYQLREILKHARVAIKRAMVRPTGPRSVRLHHVVVPFDVDRAVECWLQKERRRVMPKARQAA